jgi:hypothetical protein
MVLRSTTGVNCLEAFCVLDGRLLQRGELGWLVVMDHKDQGHAELVMLGEVESGKDDVTRARMAARQTLAGSMVLGKPAVREHSQIKPTTITGHAWWIGKRRMLDNVYLSKPPLQRTRNRHT